MQIQEIKKKIKEILDLLKLKEYEKIHNAIKINIDNNELQEKEFELILNLLQRIQNFQRGTERLDAASTRLTNLIKTKDWFTKKAVYHPYLVKSLAQESFEEFWNAQIRPQLEAISVEEVSLVKKKLAEHDLLLMAVFHDIGRQYEVLKEDGTIKYGKNNRDHARNSYRMLMLTLPSNSDLLSEYFTFKDKNGDGSGIVNFNLMNEEQLEKLDKELDLRLKQEPNPVLKSTLFAIKWHSVKHDDKDMLENLSYILDGNKIAMELAQSILSFMKDIDVASNILDYAEEGHLDLIGEANSSSIKQTAKINISVKDDIVNGRIVDIKKIPQNEQTIMDTYCKFLGWIFDIKSQSIISTLCKNGGALDVLLTDIKYRGEKLCKTEEEKSVFEKDFKEISDRIKEYSKVKTQETVKTR